jgi:hypothetical protein
VQVTDGQIDPRDHERRAADEHGQPQGPGVLAQLRPDPAGEVLDGRDHRDPGRSEQDLGGDDAVVGAEMSQDLGHGERQRPDLQRRVAGVQVQAPRRVERARPAEERGRAAPEEVPGDAAPGRHFKTPADRPQGEQHVVPVAAGPFLSGATGGCRAAAHGMLGHPAWPLCRGRLCRGRRRSVTDGAATGWLGCGRLFVPRAGHLRTFSHFSNRTAAGRGQ